MDYGSLLYLPGVHDRYNLGLRGRKFLQHKEVLGQACPSARSARDSSEACAELSETFSMCVNSPVITFLPLLFSFEMWENKNNE